MLRLGGDETAGQQPASMPIVRIAGTDTAYRLTGEGTATVLIKGYVLVNVEGTGIGALQASDVGDPECASGRGVTLYTQVAGCWARPATLKRCCSLHNRCGYNSCNRSVAPY